MNARRMGCKQEEQKTYRGPSKECENKIVYIYGPYPQRRGERSGGGDLRPSTGKRRRVRRDAARRIAGGAARRETETKPVPTVYGRSPSGSTKRAAWRHPESVARNVENRVKAWIPR